MTEPRQISGPLKNLTGQPYADQRVLIELITGFYTPDAQYVKSLLEDWTDAAGKLSVLLVPNVGDTASSYRLSVGGEVWLFTLPEGALPLSWSEVRTLGVTTQDPQYLTLAVYVDERVAAAQLDGVNVTDFATDTELAAAVEAHRVDANPHPNLTTTPGGVSSWNDLTDKPSVFPSAPHAHALADVTGLSSALASKLETVSYAEVTGKPATFAPAAHSHTIGDVGSLQTSLDGKETAGAAAAALSAHESAADPHPVYLTQAEADALYTGGTAETGPVTWTSVTGKPLTFPPDAHDHNDLYYTETETNTLLNAKAAAAHTHATADVTGLDAALATKLESVSYAEVTGKPATFPPSAHAHAVTDVTGLQTALDGKAPTTHLHAYSDITGKPTTFAPSAHSHAVADVTGLQGQLDGKAAASHTHAISDTTGLQGALDSKAATSHTHTIAQVSSLQTTLDGKEASGAAAAAVSAHTSATDPHTVYQLKSARAAANGYASLGADGKVPSGQLPAAGGATAGSIYSLIWVASATDTNKYQMKDGSAKPSIGTFFYTGPTDPTTVGIIMSPGDEWRQTF